MYDEESLRLFAAVKAICDPDNLLNPGVLVDPAPLDADLRPARPRAAGRSRAAAGRTTAARSATRCTAAPASASAWRRRPTGVMCPSYLATRDEKDSTRGRARVLQEALDGVAGARAGRPGGHRGARPLPVLQGLRVATARPASTWRRTRRRRCTRSTPAAGVAALALHAGPAARAGPRSGRAGGAALANRLMRRGPLGRLAKATAGIDQRRSLPAFAPTTLRRRSRPSATGDGSAPDVWIWADTFTDHFLPAERPRPRSGCSSRRRADRAR